MVLSTSYYIPFGGGGGITQCESQGSFCSDKTTAVIRSCRRGTASCCCSFFRSLLQYSTWGSHVFSLPNNCTVSFRILSCERKKTEKKEGGTKVAQRLWQSAFFSSKIIFEFAK